MARERTAREVRYRFHDEQEYIERYIRFLHAKSTMHDQQVLELNRILRRVEINPLPTRAYDRTAKPYSPEEIADLLAAIREVEPEVYQTILGHEQRLDDTPDFGLEGPAACYIDRLDEWVDYLVERLSDDPENEEIDVAIRGAMHLAEEVEQDLDEEDRIPPDALKALLMIAVDHTFHFKIRQRVDAMVYAREQFEAIEILARVARPEAEVNVLRQGFILLMTAFDAAVFDLVRVALRRKFFTLVGAFGKQDKISLQEIANLGSFEALRDEIIEKQLTNRSVNDLLYLLNGEWKVECVDTAAGDKFERLIEFVLRRNVHVHNRGIVDERYLDEKKNLDGLKVGDVAVIDDAYWQLANRLTARCMENVAAWAGA